MPIVPIYSKSVQLFATTLFIMAITLKIAPRYVLCTDNFYICLALPITIPSSILLSVLCISRHNNNKISVHAVHRCRVNSLVIREDALTMAADPSSAKEKEKSKTCSLCGFQYTLFRRQHHCRMCASSCCDDCSKKKVLLQGQPVSTLIF